MLNYVLVTNNFSLLLSLAQLIFFFHFESTDTVHDKYYQSISTNIYVSNPAYPRMYLLSWIK